MVVFRKKPLDGLGSSGSAPCETTFYMPREIHNQCAHGYLLTYYSSTSETRQLTALSRDQFGDRLDALSVRKGRNWSSCLNVHPVRCFQTSDTLGVDACHGARKTNSTYLSLHSTIQ